MWGLIRSKKLPKGWEGKHDGKSQGLQWSSGLQSEAGLCRFPARDLSLHKQHFFFSSENVLVGI